MRQIYNMSGDYSPPSRDVSPTTEMYVGTPDSDQATPTNGSFLEAMSVALGEACGGGPGTAFFSSQAAAELTKCFQTSCAAATGARLTLANLVPARLDYKFLV